MSSKMVKNEQLPEGWREVRLGEVGIFSKGSGITKSELVENGVPCIRYGELYTRHHFRVLDFYSFISDNNLKKHKLIKNNDLLFAGTGETKEEIGRCASFNYNIQVYAGGDVIICSIDSRKLRSDFASYYLNTIGRKQITKLGQGDSIVHLYSRFLKSITIYYPPLPEQKAIASLLEKWDTAIEKTEALIAAKEKQFKWLLKTLISDQQDNPEWREVRLGEVCKIKKGTQLNKLNMIKTGKYPVLNGGMKLSGYTGVWNTSANTVTISEGGNSCGYVNFNTHDFWAGGHCYTLTNLTDELYLDFLYHQLKGREQLIMRLRVGSGLPNIQKGDIENFPFALPLPCKQKQIAYILNTVQREVDLLKQLTEKYRTQKRGLMQKLLTGQWRVTPTRRSRESGNPEKANHV